MSILSNNIISILKKVTNQNDNNFVPLHEPLFRGNENKYVQDCIDTGWVSSVGSYVDRFEKDLADFMGVKRVVVVMNGTAALHLCMEAIGVTDGDEVLCPALTFVATPNAISYTGATPNFIDSDVDNLGVCPVKLEEYLSDIAKMDDAGNCINTKTGKTIKAIIPMHCFGHPVLMDEISAVAKKYNIIVIEDAAESLGSTYKGKSTGGLGLLGAISFNGNKIITTGGGGAVATNDEALGDRLKHLSTTAKATSNRFFVHDETGYNYRMPNLNAALGCAQLEALPEYIKTKREIANKYMELFSGLNNVDFIKEPANTNSNYWLCAIKLANPEDLKIVLNETANAQLMTRPLWALMSDLPMYKNCPKHDLSNAEFLEKRVISIPSSVNLI